MNVVVEWDFATDRDATEMNSSAASNIRILSADQSLRLLDVHRLCRAPAVPGTGLHRLACLISDVIDVKAALAAKGAGGWAVLAESRTEPHLPAAGAAAWLTFDRVAATLEDGVQTWSHEHVDWTLVDLGSRAGVPAVLLLEGDWTLSNSVLVQFAGTLVFAERALVASRRADVGAATHRLTRTLARVAGLPEVCAAVLRHVTRVVPSRLAAFAVADEEEQMAIVATHGYPKAVVEHIRISPGHGIIGSVYQKRAPLLITDVTLRPDFRRRSRYRTNSFVALPIVAGTQVLGVVCVADRLDGRPFTREDISALRMVTAPAALALACERARQQADQFARAAIVDPVSGLFNRRYFEARLEEELQRARRHNTHVALLMVDIDDFKRINDRFGHLTGDAVIKGVSEILQRSVRKFDLCARFGGEEFAVVMPGSGPEDSASVAERIRQRIQEFRPQGDELADVHVAASIGLSVSRDVSGRDLIERADQALYDAKRAGKNRVIMWAPPGIAPPETKP